MARLNNGKSGRSKDEQAKTPKGALFCALEASCVFVIEYGLLSRLRPLTASLIPCTLPTFSAESQHIPGIISLLWFSILPWLDQINFRAMLMRNAHTVGAQASPTVAYHCHTSEAQEKQQLCLPALRWDDFHIARHSVFKTLP